MKIQGKKRNINAYGWGHLNYPSVSKACRKGAAALAVLGGPCWFNQQVRNLRIPGGMGLSSSCCSEASDPQASIKKAEFFNWGRNRTRKARGREYWEDKWNDHSLRGSNLWVLAGGLQQLWHSPRPVSQALQETQNSILGSEKSIYQQLFHTPCWWWELNSDSERIPMVEVNSSCLKKKKKEEPDILKTSTSSSTP